MEEIIKVRYKSIDGKMFDEKADCQKHEKIVKQVVKIMKDFCPLPKDDGCRFANGGGYLQHKKVYVEKAKKDITEFGNKLFKITPKTNFNWIGRYFDDSGYKVCYDAWIRLSHIDNQYREWGQGYYAINPEKGVQEPFIEKKK